MWLAVVQGSQRLQLQSSVDALGHAVVTPVLLLLLPRLLVLLPVLLRV
jgi:hypothetical protein